MKTPQRPLFISITFIAAAMSAALLSGCATSGASTAASASVPAADPKLPPKAVLWVGNSYFYYNNSMHGHV
jgi:hypothetical protein